MELYYTEQQNDQVRFSIKVKRHLFTGQSDFQEVDILESEEFGKFLTLDGLMMVTEKDEFIYHDMIAHVPMATNPRIKRVLVIGGGDGGTVREITRYPQVEKIDMVEIDKMVVDVCREYLPITSAKLDDPRVSLYYEDGIKFVKDSAEKYDLILVDSTDPIGPGEGLFTTEFYQNCYDLLTEDGILINQSESPYYQPFSHEMKRAHDKIKNIFPISRIYQFHMPTYPSGHWLFGFASKRLDPISDPDFAAWEKLGLTTKYYNPALHLGAFALPTYVQRMLEEE